MITTFRSASSRSICSKCAVKLDRRDFPPHRVSVSCDVLQEPSLPHRSRTTLRRNSASVRAPFILSLSARGVSHVVLSGWPRFGSCSSVLRVALPLVVPRSVALGSFQSIIVFFRTLTFFSCPGRRHRSRGRCRSFGRSPACS